MSLNIRNIYKPAREAIQDKGWGKGWVRGCKGCLREGKGDLREG